MSTHSRIPTALRKKFFGSKSPTNHPNFFIVGAGKSGTTSLWVYLTQHPEVYMHPTIKEPSFFCNLCGCRDFDAYLRLFADVQEEKAVGEASHAYLTSPESAAWIQKVYPEAKIIITLRNPVDRAYSLYNWMIREGYEWVYPFEKALVAEKDRIADEYFKYNNPQYYYNYLYFNSGLYAEQINRYLELFSKKQILFILFEDLKTNPVSTTKQVYEFLGVDSSFVPKIEIHNSSRTPFSIPAQYFIKQKLFKYLCKFHLPVVSSIEKAVLNTNIYFGRNSEVTLNADIRRNMLKLYKKNIQLTASLIKCDLGNWTIGD